MNTTSLDYLGKVAEFTEFIGLRSHDQKDVLRFLTLSTFQELSVTCIAITELEDSGDLRVSGIFGIDRSAFECFPIISKISDANPIAEVLRLRRIVWINTLPNWPSEYPNLKGLTLPNNEATIICFPIDKFGLPGACLTLFSTEVIDLSVEMQSYLRAIGSIFSLYLFKDDLEERIRRAADEISQDRLRRPKSDDKSFVLSDRQIVILKLISQGLTNIKISEQIGYSESTVRQETMRIFATLGCSNRREAGQIYIDLYSENMEAAG
jgi:DNA-binding NarL/FixJ family response regulator